MGGWMLCFCPTLIGAFSSPYVHPQLLLNVKAADVLLSALRTDVDLKRGEVVDLVQQLAPAAGRITLSMASNAKSLVIDASCLYTLVCVPIIEMTIFA
jgi:hypothetical protein